MNDVEQKTRRRHLDKVAALAVMRDVSEEKFRAAVVEAWNAGVSIRQIAQAAGYKSHGTLYQFVKRNEGN